MTHAGGRPPEYKEEYIQKAEEYLKICIDEEDEYHKTRGEKSDTYEKTLKVKLPTLKGFALFIGVNESTLYEWDKTYPEFSKSLDKIKTEQHDRLINNSLSGDYNPLIAKLVLSSNHGYKEKSDVTTNDKDLPTPIAYVQRNDSIQEDKPTEEEN